MPGATVYYSSILVALCVVTATARPVHRAGAPSSRWIAAALDAPRAQSRAIWSSGGLAGVPNLVSGLSSSPAMAPFLSPPPSTAALLPGHASLPILPTMSAAQLPTHPAMTAPVASWASMREYSNLSDFGISKFAYGQENLRLISSLPSSAVGDTPATANPAAPDSNSTIMQLFFPAGSYNPQNAPRGGADFYALPALLNTSLRVATSASLSYSVFFPHGFDWVKGGKLPGLYGGHVTCSGGDDAEDCFSTRIMWRSAGKGELYLYAPRDKQTPELCKTPPESVCATAYGLSIGRGSFYFTPGAWTTVRQTVVLNTPGVVDGQFTLDVNGERVLHLQSIWYRGAATSTAAAPVAPDIHGNSGNHHLSGLTTPTVPFSPLSTTGDVAGAALNGIHKSPSPVSPLVAKPTTNLNPAVDAFDASHYSALADDGLAPVALQELEPVLSHRAVLDDSQDCISLAEVDEMQPEHYAALGESEAILAQAAAMPAQPVGILAVSANRYAALGRFPAEAPGATSAIRRSSVDSQCSALALDAAAVPSTSSQLKYAPTTVYTLPSPTSAAARVQTTSVMASPWSVPMTVFTLPSIASASVRSSSLTVPSAPSVATSSVAISEVSVSPPSAYHSTGTGTSMRASSATTNTSKPAPSTSSTAEALLSPSPSPVAPPENVASVPAGQLQDATNDLAQFGFSGLFFSTFFGGHTLDYATPTDQFLFFRDFEIVVNAVANGV